MPLIGWISASLVLAEAVSAIRGRTVNTTSATSFTVSGPATIFVATPAGAGIQDLTRGSVSPPGGQ